MTADYYDVWGVPDRPRQRRKTPAKKKKPQKFRHPFCGCRPGPKGKTCKRCKLIEDYQNARGAIRTQT